MTDLSTSIVDSKIKTLDSLASITKDLKQRGCVVVQCHGVFDLLHPGHIRHFEAAKRQGDVLVVTITKDEYVNKGPGRPVFNQQLRMESLAALQAVDYVALSEAPTAVEAIKKLAPNIYAKGQDYANSKNDLTGKITDEESAVTSVGGRIYFTDEITFSSTSLLNAHFPVFSDEAAAFLKNFRQKYSADDVRNYLDTLQDLKVMVIGDAIIDEYHYCQSMGKSAKELLISTKYVSQEAFAGGIFAVANHLAGFCTQVDMVTCLGSQDSREAFIREHLLPNVHPTFFYRSDAPTVVKRRFVEQAFLSKMFQVCYMNDQPLPETVQHSLMGYLASCAGSYDLVVVADYGHGFLGESTIQQLCASSRFLAINVQTNSANAGYNMVTKYPRADYVCIDEPEIRLAMRTKMTPVPQLIAQLADQKDYQRFAITRGHRATYTYEPAKGLFETPVFSKNVVDRMGAGDAFLAVTAPCVAAGLPLDLVGFVGNAVGALAVGIVGNRSPVERVPLLRFINTLLK